MKTYMEFTINSKTVKIVETNDKNQPFKWVEVRKENTNAKATE